VGDAVKRGDVIGLVGMKGRATGPHLHWSMSWFQMRLDPSRSTATAAPEKG
jgi:murein DD-endopeptidase MepM/ murein hydrolase activator NlpD